MTTLHPDPLVNERMMQRRLLTAAPLECNDYSMVSESECKVQKSGSIPRFCIHTETLRDCPICQTCLSDRSTTYGMPSNTNGMLAPTNGMSAPTNGMSVTTNGMPSTTNLFINIHGLRGLSQERSAYILDQVQTNLSEVGFVDDGTNWISPQTTRQSITIPITTSAPLNVNAGAPLTEMDIEQQRVQTEIWGHLKDVLEKISLYDLVIILKSILEMDLDNDGSRDIFQLLGLVRTTLFNRPEINNEEDLRSILSEYQNNSLNDSNLNENEMQLLNRILGESTRNIKPLKQTNEYRRTKINNVEASVRTNHKFDTAFHPGYSYLPPNSWETHKKKPPVCIQDKRNVSNPAFVFDSGTPALALDFETGNRLMPSFTYLEHSPKIGEDDYLEYGKDNSNFGNVSGDRRGINYSNTQRNRRNNSDPNQNNIGKDINFAQSFLREMDGIDEYEGNPYVKSTDVDYRTRFSGNVNNVERR